MGTNVDRVTNPCPHLTDFAHEIRIRRIQIFAGSVTSLDGNDDSQGSHGS